MRGYPPTAIPKDGFYDAATLAADLRGLVEALGEGDPAFVVGHDWGAGMAYTAAAAFPGLFRRAVTMAVPHPAALAGIGGNYDQIRRSFYVWFFQLAGLPEVALAQDDFAFVERLWRDWSPGLRDDDQVAIVKRTLARPGAAEAAIAYYRAIFDPDRWDPALAHTRASAVRAIDVPTLHLHGADDGCIGAEFTHGAEALFTREYRVEILSGCGHFLHRERPDEVNRLILDWLGSA
jgi:pimeloyl-ACP methyl ester carboxylesterase